MWQGKWGKSTAVATHNTEYCLSFKYTYFDVTGNTTFLVVDIHNHSMHVRSYPLNSVQNNLLLIGLQVRHVCGHLQKWFTPYNNGAAKSERVIFKQSPQ